MAAYRTDTGSAVVEWPSTPDPVDPDAYEVSPEPTMMVLAARSAAVRKPGWAYLLCAFVVAFLVMCLGAGLALAQPPVPEPKPPHVTAPSNPRMPCHNATEIAKQLSNQYDEVTVAFGLQSNGNLLQVYSSDAKDTWTVVSTTPDGISCIVAAGHGWENLPVGSPIGYGEP